MRHGDGHRKFNMPKSQRRALFSNLTSALLEHEQITITLTRAKELRTFADNMITFAKKGDLNSRRLAAGFLRVNYNYDEKYLLSASVRAEGSSRSLLR